MKKKLESELTSIAHNILKLRGKEDINAMLKQTQRLYEALLVYKFIEENFGEAAASIGDLPFLDQFFGTTEAKIKEEIPVVEKKEENTERTEALQKFEEMAGNVLTDNREVPENNPNEDDIVSPLMETIRGMVSEMPEHERKMETLEDILAGVLPEPMFVKKEEIQVKHEPEISEEVSEPAFVPKEEVPEVTPPEPKQEITPEPVHEKKSLSLNDRAFRQGIQIGLNDRIGFVKHLFAGNADEYASVLTQLNGTSSFTEAQNIIENIVKPHFNNWEGKEDYEVRFYAIVEKKFN